MSLDHTRIILIFFNNGTTTCKMKYATEVNVCLKDGRLVRVESRNGQKYLKDKPDQGEMKYSSGKIKCSLDRILKFKYTTTLN